ncbi:MAG: mevalonate kinase [Nitrososphaerales archaeon]
MKSEIKSVTASAPGKIIICGEHFVVHGSYAVAAAIDRRASVTVSSTGEKDSSISSRGLTASLDSKHGLFATTKAIVTRIFADYGKPSNGVRIYISSDIPSGSGLGSSAAVSVATAAALTKFLGHQPEESKICETASCGEKEVHGNPSGIDIHASVSGGMILFNKNSGAKPVPLNRSIQFLVVYSGRQRKTSELVSKVALKKKESPKFFERLTEAANFFSLEVVESVTGGDLPYLGAIMNMMQASLSWIGVSTSSLDALIEAVLTEDSYGAKITGAGGGGSVIVLPKADRADQLLKHVAANYKDSFLCTIPQEGLRWENPQ